MAHNGMAVLSILTSIHQLPAPLLPLIVQSKLVILTNVNSLSLNYPISSRFRTLLLVLSPKCLSPVMSLPSYVLSTGSESLGASTTSSCHLPTNFSQLPNLNTL